MLVLCGKNSLLYHMGHSMQVSAILRARADICCDKRNLGATYNVFRDSTVDQYHYCDVHTYRKTKVPAVFTINIASGQPCSMTKREEQQQNLLEEEEEALRQPSGVYTMIKSPKKEAHLVTRLIY